VSLRYRQDKPAQESGCNAKCDIHDSGATAGWLLIAPVIRTSINGNSFATAPASINDPRLHSAPFYMDDDHSPAEPTSRDDSNR
jgi:hypothetical protein